MKTLRVGLVLWLILPLAAAVRTSPMSAADTGLLQGKRIVGGNMRVV